MNKETSAHKSHLCLLYFLSQTNIECSFNSCLALFISDIVIFVCLWGLVSYQSLRFAILGPPALRNSDKVRNTKVLFMLWAFGRHFNKV